MNNIIFRFAAIRYNGRYLYEDLIENFDFDLVNRKSSAVDVERTFVIENHSDAINKFSAGEPAATTLNESGVSANNQIQKRI